MLAAMSLLIRIVAGLVCGALGALAAVGAYAEMNRVPDQS